MSNLGALGKKGDDLPFNGHSQGNSVSKQFLMMIILNAHILFPRVVKSPFHLEGTIWALRRPGAEPTAYGDFNAVTTTTSFSSAVGRNQIFVTHQQDVNSPFSHGAPAHP